MLASQPCRCSEGHRLVLQQAGRGWSGSGCDRAVGSKLSYILLLPLIFIPLFHGADPSILHYLYLITFQRGIGQIFKQSLGESNLTSLQKKGNYLKNNLLSLWLLIPNCKSLKHSHLLIHSRQSIEIILLKERGSIYHTGLMIELQIFKQIRRTFVLQNSFLHQNVDIVP